MSNLSRLSFKLDIQKCPTDITPLETLLQQKESLRLLLQPFIDIHVNHARLENKPTKDDFFAYLRKVDTVMNDFGSYGALSTESDAFEVEFEPEFYMVWPDGTLMTNRKSISENVPNKHPDKTNVMMIQFTEKQFLNLADPRDIQVETESLEEDLEHLVGLMLLTETCFGALTNGMSLAFLEINFEALKQSLEAGTVSESIPIKLYCTDGRALGPTAIQSWCTWYLKCFNTVSERKIMKGLKYIYFTDHLKGRFPVNEGQMNLEAPLIEVDHNEYSVIRAGECPFQVFQVPASKLATFNHNLEPNDQVVLKIFDEKLCEKSFVKHFGSRSVKRSFIRPYQNETTCLRRLSKDPEFNNCFLDYGNVWAKVNTPIGQISGKCILTKFIDGVPIRDDDETREQLKQQLRIVHKHGIVHNNIIKRNILYDREGKVYIIGFDKAEIIESTDEEDYSVDFDCLEGVFDDPLHDLSFAHTQSLSS